MVHHIPQRLQYLVPPLQLAHPLLCRPHKNQVIDSPAGPAPPSPSSPADTSPSSETTSWGHHTSLCRVPILLLFLSSSSYHSGLQSLYDFNISISMQYRCRPTSCLSRHKDSEIFLFFFNLMHFFNIISHAIPFRPRQSSQKPL